MPESESGLIRSIRKWDLVAVMVNAVIGAGIFGLPSKVYALVGNYSLLVFLLCAVFAAMIVLCFAEVGSRFTETGGPYLYAREAFGSTAGFTIGWLMWIARVTAFAANTSIMLSYLALFFPTLATGPVRAAVVCTVTIALAMINVFGVRDVAITTNILAIGKLVPLVILILAGIFYLNPQSFSFGSPPPAIAFPRAMLLLVYAYTGFEMAVIPAGEIKDPRRNVPIAILTGIGVVAVFYVLIQIVCIGTLPGLSASDRPLADAASRFLGRPGSAILSAGAVVSILGNLNVVMLSASRLPFAMARRGELPHFLAAVNERFRTPHAAILLTSALMGAVTLSGTFLYAVTMSTLTRLFIYAATCAALPIFRRRAGAPELNFRVPAGSFVSIAVLALTTWLLCNCTWLEVRDTVIAAAIGLAMYTICRRGPIDKPEVVVPDSVSRKAGSGANSK
jgi:APA family basic amino acid/polyamine antiporter